MSIINNQIDLQSASSSSLEVSTLKNEKLCCTPDKNSILANMSSTTTTQLTVSDLESLKTRLSELEAENKDLKRMVASSFCCCPRGIMCDTHRSKYDGDAWHRQMLKDATNQTPRVSVEEYDLLMQDERERMRIANEKEIEKIKEFRRALRAEEKVALADKQKADKERAEQAAKVKAANLKNKSKKPPPMLPPLVLSPIAEEPALPVIPVDMLETPVEVETPSKIFKKKQGWSKKTESMDTILSTLQLDTIVEEVVEVEEKVEVEERVEVEEEKVEEENVEEEKVEEEKVEEEKVEADETKEDDLYNQLILKTMKELKEIAKQNKIYNYSRITKRCDLIDAIINPPTKPQVKPIEVPELPVTLTPEYLNTLSLKQLSLICKERNLKNYTKCKKKQDLVTFIIERL
jgi:hypothetical protein